MSDAQTDGMFPTRSEREAEKRQQRESAAILKNREELLTSIQQYLQRPNQKRFDLALRNLRKSSRKPSIVLEGLQAQNEIIWAGFLSEIVEEEWFEKFQKLSPFRDQVIAIGNVGFSEVTFRTNTRFKSYLLGRRPDPFGSILTVFGKGSKNNSIEIRVS